VSPNSRSLPAALLLSYVEKEQSSRARFGQADQPKRTGEESFLKNARSEFFSAGESGSEIERIKKASK
jgi:hypothetical protein